VLRRGDHEIFLYPKGARVEFVDGKVVDVKGSLPPAPAAPVAPATPAEVAATAPSAAPVAAPANPTPAPPPRVDKPAITPPPAPAVASPPEPIYPDDEDARMGLTIGIAIITLIVMLVLQFGLTFAALKIAFHYHQMDALWSGILAITGIDVALQTVMAVVHYFQSGELLLGPAGTGLPGFAMIFTIRKFCLDQRWQRAVATTGAVKVASILLTLGLLALVHRFLG